MYSHILAAVDLDEGHELVVRKAVKMAKACDARISFVHVIHHEFVSLAWAPAVAGYGFMERTSEEEMRKKVDAANAALKTLADRCGLTDVATHVWIATSVKTAVRKVAAAEKTDLIVIGSHIRSGSERLLFRSPGYEIVRGAPCDILVVDQPESS